MEQNIVTFRQQTWYASNKADRPLKRWLSTHYWQTDNSNGLVMVIRNYHSLNLASRVLISTCSAPLVQTGEH